MTSVETATASAAEGLVGDRYSGRTGSRQVTLIQQEHLAAIASHLGLDRIAPEQLRRNIVVEGINLAALKDHRFRLGTAVLAWTGECHPCSRMEEAFGPGGYNAVRGHGGERRGSSRAGPSRPATGWNGFPQPACSFFG